MNIYIEVANFLSNIHICIPFEFNPILILRIQSIVQPIQLQLSTFSFEIVTAFPLLVWKFSSSFVWSLKNFCNLRNDVRERSIINLNTLFIIFLKVFNFLSGVSRISAIWDVIAASGFLRTNLICVSMFASKSKQVLNVSKIWMASLMIGFKILQTPIDIVALSFLYRHR